MYTSKKNCINIWFEHKWKWFKQKFSRLTCTGVTTYGIDINDVARLHGEGADMVFEEIMWLNIELHTINNLINMLC